MTTLAASGSNSGYLKLELSAKGMRLDDAARSRSGIQPSVQREGEPDHGIELVLPDDVLVSVPIDEAASVDSPFVLSGVSEQFTLHRNGGNVDVRLVPPPRFYTQTTSNGRAMRQVGAVYGPFIAINPAAACGYSLRGAPCRFCRSGTGAASQDRVPLSVQDTVDVVRAAFAEGVVEFVYFNPPFSGGEDGGIAALEPYIEAVKKHFDTLIAVQIHPPQAFSWITRTYAMGVDALSYSVEIHDGEVLSRRCPGRVRYIGRERYYEALAHAASVFPSGTVWSDLILPPSQRCVASTRWWVSACCRFCRRCVAATVSPLAARCQPSTRCDRFLRISSARCGGRGSTPGGCPTSATRSHRSRRASSSATIRVRRSRCSSSIDHG